MNLFPKPPSILQTINELDKWPNFVWEEFKQRAINVKWFGAKGDGVTDDTQAFLNAFDALNGTSPKFLLLPAETYLLDFDGDINIPINVKIISLTRATIKLGQPNTRLTYISPGTSSGGYVQYWSYMNAGFINITVTGTGTKTVKTLLLISKMLGAKFENCSFSNAITGVHIQNRDGLWTEKTDFVNCGFSNCTYNIHFDGNLYTVEPGTTAGVSNGSFAYTTFKNCSLSIGDNAGEEVDIYVSNGATLYGGSIDFRGWLKNSNCKFIKTDRGSITYMDFNVVAESFGNDAHFLHLTGGKFWYNKGNARFPSPEIKMYQDATTAPDILGNAITVIGTELQRDDGTSLFLGDQIPSIIVDHLLKRHIIRREIIHFSKFGSASGYIGLMPIKNGAGTKYRIIKAEIGCKTPGSDNTGGKWYFDFRKGFDDDNWMYAGTTSFYIPDGTKRIVLHMDYKFPDNTWYGAPTVFASAPTTAESKNDGTPPEDVFIVLHYVIDKN